MRDRDAAHPVPVPLEVRVARVDRGGADGAGPPVVQFGARHREAPAGGDTALVRLEDRARRHAQHRGVHELGAHREVRVLAGAVGKRLGPEVGGRDGDSEPGAGQAVDDLEAQGERVADLGVQHVGRDDTVLAALIELPVCPPDQAVDGVAVLGLGQRRLVVGPAELVPTVTDAVGPRDQQLTTAAGGHLVPGEAVEQVDTADGVAAQPGAHLGDDGALHAADQLDLLP